MVCHVVVASVSLPDMHFTLVNQHLQIASELHQTVQILAESVQIAWTI
jgi:hypothetical protein